MSTDDYELDDLICPECGHEGTKTTRCHQCGGDGCFDTSDEDYLLEGSQYESCEECKGSGILMCCQSCNADLSGRHDLIDPYDFATMNVPDKAGTCGKCGKVTSVVQTHIDGDSVEGLLCYECCGEGGYCFGCGVFASGLSEYDFSTIGHYCEYCQDQIRTDCGEDY